MQSLIFDADQITHTCSAFGEDKGLFYSMQIRWSSKDSSWAFPKLKDTHITTREDAETPSLENWKTSISYSIAR